MLPHSEDLISQEKSSMKQKAAEAPYIQSKEIGPKFLM